MAKSEKVEIFVPRGGEREDANLFIGVNGVNYLLPKGKKSKVPKEVADEYNRMVAAVEQSYENKESLQKKGE